MKRVFVYAALASLLAATVGACDDGGSYYNPGRQGGEGYCDQYQSCGSCTPVLGCGWCTGPTGTGVCAADPDDCPTEEFSWTWDPSGCLTPADASVSGPPDGASWVGDAGTSVRDSESGEAQDAASQLEEAGDASSPCPSSSGDASSDAAHCD